MAPLVLSFDGNIGQGNLPWLKKPVNAFNLHHCSTLFECAYFTRTSRYLENNC